MTIDIGIASSFTRMPKAGPLFIANRLSDEFSPDGLRNMPLMTILAIESEYLAYDSPSPDDAAATRRLIVALENHWVHRDRPIDNYMALTFDGQDVSAVNGYLWPQRPPTDFFDNQIAPLFDRDMDGDPFDCVVAETNVPALVDAFLNYVREDNPSATDIDTAALFVADASAVLNQREAPHSETLIITQAS